MPKLLAEKSAFSLSSIAESSSPASSFIWSSIPTFRFTALLSSQHELLQALVLVLCRQKAFSNCVAHALAWRLSLRSAFLFPTQDNCTCVDVGAALLAYQDINPTALIKVQR